MYVNEWMDGDCRISGQTLTDRQINMKQKAEGHVNKLKNTLINKYTNNQTMKSVQHFTFITNWTSQMAVQHITDVHFIYTCSHSSKYFKKQKILFLLSAILADSTCVLT